MLNEKWQNSLNWHICHSCASGPTSQIHMDIFLLFESQFQLYHTELQSITPTRSHFVWEGNFILDVFYSFIITVTVGGTLQTEFIILTRQFLLKSLASIQLTLYTHQIQGTLHLNKCMFYFNRNFKRKISAFSFQFLKNTS